MNTHYRSCRGLWIYMYMIRERSLPCFLLGVVPVLVIIIFVLLLIFSSYFTRTLHSSVLLNRRSASVLIVSESILFQRLAENFSFDSGSSRETTFPPRNKSLKNIQTAESLYLFNFCTDDSEIDVEV